MDGEFEADFFGAHLIIILLDAKQGEPLSDNLALGEVSHIGNRPLLVYVSSKASSDDTRNLNLPVPVVLVGGVEEFERQLRNQLEQFMLED